MSRRHDIETYQYRGCLIRIQHDDDHENPREWDNVGTMVCWHRRYNLGDEQPKEEAWEYLLDLARKVDKKFDRLCERWEEDGALEARVKAMRDEVLARHYVILPLYLYDHSGISMAVAKFSCPWDSGQVGFIYCSRERAFKEWSAKSWRKKDKEGKTLRQRVEEVLRGEVKTYDHHLTGSVYWYECVTPGGEQIDSCGGYYGYDEGVKEDGYMVKDNAKPAIDEYVKDNPLPEEGSEVHVADVGDGVVTDIDFDDEEYEVEMGEELQRFSFADVMLKSEWEKIRHSNTAELPY